MSALTDILVVSLEQAVAAPYTSRLLAEAGARVIKLERPEGDFARAYDDIVLGDSAYFVWLNGGKESLTIDLKKDEDKSLLTKMLRKADVFIQNLRAGAVERLGFGYDDVSAFNPGLVMCTISGYGLTGDYASMKAYDFLIQAESGLSFITGPPNQPSRCGVSICDISTGLTAYAEILKALIDRGRTGKGTHLDISLFEVITEWMTVPLAYSKYGGRTLTGTGVDHPQIAPYGAFETADGTIIIAVQSAREWEDLCTKVLGRPELIADDRFKTNMLRLEHRAVLKEEIEKFFTQYTRSEMADRLEAGGVAYGRLNSVEDVWRHPQLRTREVRTSGKTAILVRRTGDSGQRTLEVPALGQHSAAIRNEFSDHKD
jgi:crotonobetainyl-CoA:carnitine CoA-transferase CaiB-like acyl-CoA transferase